MHGKGKERMNKKLSRRDFLKLAGVTSAGFALSACGVKAIELPTATSLPTPTLTPNPTDTPQPSPTATPTPLTLRELGQRLGVVFGTISDGIDDWQNPLYRKTLGTHFNSMMTSGQILPQVIEKYEPNWDGGTQSVRKLATEQKLILHLHPGFYPRYFPESLRNSNNAEVISYTKERITRLLSLVNKVDEGYEPTFLNFVNEAIWSWQGKAGWYTDDEKGKNPLYRVFEKKWLSQVYTMIYEQAETMGKKIGKDLVMIYNDADLTSSYIEHSNLVLESLLTVKQEIADELKMSLESVQLDIGIQQHLSLKPEQDFPYILPPTDDDLYKTIEKFSAVGRIHLTEFDIKNTK